MSAVVAEFQSIYDEVAKAYSGTFEEMQKYYAEDCKVFMSLSKKEFIGRQNLRPLYDAIRSKVGVQPVTVTMKVLDAEKFDDKQAWVEGHFIAMNKDGVQMGEARFLTIWKKGDEGEYRIYRHAALSYQGGASTGKA